VSKSWTFLSHHGHVLILLAKNPDDTIDNLALQAGVTSRSVTSILKDLEGANYITKRKMGRRNHYEINTQGPLRHPTSAQRTTGELIQSLGAFRA
jgi:DNA-binding MarR family transcriptional regulator